MCRTSLLAAFVLIGACSRGLSSPSQEVLTDIGRWDSAAPETRRTAADEVARRASDFSLLRLETFTCGEQKHEVAVFLHPKTGLEFVLVPSGTFVMKSLRGEVRPDAPRSNRHVTNMEPYLMARTFATRAAWRRVMGGESATDGYDVSPVTSVSWDEARSFCERTGLSLPSEAQWEWACRSGSTTRWPFGDDDSQLESYAWTDAHRDAQPHAVAQKKPNGVGLFDTLGSTWHWCEDAWRADISESPIDGSAWTDSSTPLRVLRGGFLGWPAFREFAADRTPSLRDSRIDWVGFRPVAGLSIK